MMTFVTIEEAQQHLADLIDKLIPGEEKIVTCNGHPIARIERLPNPPSGPRELGAQRGSILYMADDFNASMDLEDSKG
jgi:antitoxin (DNA-binding transcriptional repressor) of toxin-antitoxin stability system